MVKQSVMHTTITLIIGAVVFAIFSIGVDSIVATSIHTSVGNEVIVNQLNDSNSDLVAKNSYQALMPLLYSLKYLAAVLCMAIYGSIVYIRKKKKLQNSKK